MPIYKRESFLNDLEGLRSDGNPRHAYWAANEVLNAFSNAKHALELNRALLEDEKELLQAAEDIRALAQAMGDRIRAQIQERALNQPARLKW